jgi:hypothetical protein
LICSQNPPITIPSRTFRHEARNRDCIPKGIIAHQPGQVVNLKSRRVQCDEIWSFVNATQKNVPEDLKGQFGVGDVPAATALPQNTAMTLLRYRDGIAKVCPSTAFEKRPSAGVLSGTFESFPPDSRVPIIRAVLMQLEPKNKLTPRQEMPAVER